MTDPAKLFDRIEKNFEYRSGGLAYIDEDAIAVICAEYEQRIADLERNNSIMAARLLEQQK